MFIKTFILFFIFFHLYHNFVLTDKLKWRSLDKRPLPSWYDEAKVGIIIHWGVYSVPVIGSELFWKSWKDGKDKAYVDFMKKNYKPSFAYQDFAQEFTAELFDVNRWVKLFQASGAKYVVLTSKHHDGYALWPSKTSFNWNSMDIGPKRDIIKELSECIRNHTNIKFGLYYSLFEWYNSMFIDDQLNSFKTNNYVKNKVMPDLRELVEYYLPEILWSDGDWVASSIYWNATEFLTWLYTSSPVYKTVVTNDRWGKDVSCIHGDFYTCSKYYNLSVIKSAMKKHKWEKPLKLDKTSWGHRFDTDLSNIITSKQLIRELVITVSCNGNLLVNIGPTMYGTIPPIFQERLIDMGMWLQNNGEAIYSSEPWIFQEDALTKGVWYTKQRTLTIHRIDLYAIILDYPFDTNTITLYSLAGKIDKKTNIQLLGQFGEYRELRWNFTSTNVSIEFPRKVFLDYHNLKFAWTFKIDILA